MTTNSTAAIVSFLRPDAAFTIVRGVVKMDDGSKAPTKAEILAGDAALSAVIPVPQEVSRFQALAALLHAGLLDDVETAVAGADRFTQIAWSNASTFARASPTIATLAAALGLSDAQVDDLFRAAALIST